MSRIANPAQQSLLNNPFSTILLNSLLLDVYK
jgi:hypothetical protein